MVGWRVRWFVVPFSDRQCTDFGILGRNGVGTFLRTGKPTDSTRAQANGKLAKDWCRAHGLQLTVDFAWSLYDKASIQALAIFGAQKLQYLYDLRLLDSGRASHRYTNVELQSFPGPCDGSSVEKMNAEAHWPIH